MCLGSAPKKGSQQQQGTSNPKGSKGGQDEAAGGAAPGVKPQEPKEQPAGESKLICSVLKQAGIIFLQNLSFFVHVVISI